MPVVLGTIHPDFLDAYFVGCLMETLETADYLVRRNRLLMARAPSGMLHVARTAIVRQFLEHPEWPDYLVFIDTDIAWAEWQLRQLIASAYEHQLAVVSGLVAMPGTSTMAVARPVMYDEALRIVEPTGGLQQVFCAGSAFLAVRRDAFIHCQRAYHHYDLAPWFTYGEYRGKIVSEDVMFAVRLQKLGIPVFVNTDVRIGQREIHEFRLRQVEQPEKV